MHKSLQLNHTGGLKDCQDVTLRFMQEAYGEALDGLAAMVGNKTIVSGVANNNGTVSNGWVSYNGTLLPFTGGNLSQQPYVDFGLVITGEQYDDGTLKPFYEERTLAMVAVASGTSFPFTDLVRPQTLRTTWVKGDVKHHKCDAAYIAANFDPSTWVALPGSDLYGWKIDLDAGGRVIMGYHVSATDPGGDAAWSTDAHMIGSKFGERLHTLLAAESGTGPHDHNFAGSSNDGFQGMKLTANKDQQRLGQYLTNSPTNTVVNGGNDAQQGHNNIQPSIVYLTLEKL